jgi:hypothetical protein
MHTASYYNNQKYEFNKIAKEGWDDLQTALIVGKEDWTWSYTEVFPVLLVQDG